MPPLPRASSRAETDDVPFYCPVNEISYWAWAGGTVGRINPASRRRGRELKRQLVRCAIAAIEAVREVDARARFVHAEPLINIVARTPDHNEAQFEAWDMLTGRAAPELGGRPDYLDIAGLNYYPDNQWRARARPFPLGHHLYRPLRELLAASTRATGGRSTLPRPARSGAARAAWLLLCRRRGARRDARGRAGRGRLPLPDPGLSGLGGRASLRGRPVLHADEAGHRSTCRDLAEELARQQALVAELHCSRLSPPSGAVA